MITAQEDNRNKSVKIPAVKIENKRDSTTLNIRAETNVKEAEIDAPKNNTKGHNNPKTDFDLNSSNKPFSMLSDNILRDPGELSEERWLKKAEDEGIKPKTMVVQYMGEHRIYANFVKLMYKDRKIPDSDVKILSNDKLIARNEQPSGSYKIITINLVEGFNKIDFQALGQVCNDSNTELIIVDDQGNLVSSKKWNLYTGVKATIVFINEKPLGYEETKTPEKEKED